MYSVFNMCLDISTILIIMLKCLLSSKYYCSIDNNAKNTVLQGLKRPIPCTAKYFNINLTSFPLHTTPSETHPHDSTPSAPCTKQSLPSPTHDKPPQVGPEVVSNRLKRFTVPIEQQTEWESARLWAQVGEAITKEDQVGVISL